MQAVIAPSCGLAFAAGRLPRQARSTSSLQQRSTWRQARLSRRELLARAEGQEQPATEQQPAAQQPQQQQQQPPQEEEPIWVRRERERALIEKEGKDLPFGLYLVFSALVAIAATGSIFEYINGRPAFGVIQPDSPFYALLLGFFVVTGFPMAGFLFYKAISAANKEAERMDKLDGY